jgi:methylmalonyl-CoA/ethylmalonyl-CoA epimerase
MQKKCFLFTLICLLAINSFPCQEKLPKSNIVAQIGVVVKNIEKSSRAYAEVLGVGVPEWELTDPVERSHTQYLGQATKAQAKLAFFELGNIVIELIEPVGGPSTWQDFLVNKGEGVHHIAFEIKGMDDRVSELKTHGLPLIQSGDYTGGRYSYLDGSLKLGLILELLESLPQKKPINPVSGKKD